jgi:hypothetical protein
MTEEEFYNKFYEADPRFNSPWKNLSITIKQIYKSAFPIKISVSIMETVLKHLCSAKELSKVVAQQSDPLIITTITYEGNEDYWEEFYSNISRLFDIIKTISLEFLIGKTYRLKSSKKKFIVVPIVVTHADLPLEEGTIYIRFLNEREVIGLKTKDLETESELVLD